MVRIQSHRDLIVWQRSMELVQIVYTLTRKLPDCERFVLCPQICRSAISVPANIAEGHARGGPRAFCNFLSIARGSLMELETYLLLIEKLGYAKGPDLARAFDEASQVSRMLVSLRKKIAAKARTDGRYQDGEPAVAET